MDLQTEDRGTILFVHRTPIFDRCLNDLRDRGGTDSLAAKRVDEIICSLTSRGNESAKDRFRVTRKGERRISNCKKIVLGCGYRLVCMQKDSHLVLLYVGPHDDCFRWIEHNKGLDYETEDLTRAIKVLCDSDATANHLPEDVLEERKFAEAYEADLMSRIDDDVLYMVFSGLCKR
ncbi:MAG: hypothetical protein ACLPN1_16095 [Dissulfurispiraceae bacterium]|jgi:hypothetical protein